MIFTECVPFLIVLNNEEPYTINTETLLVARTKRNMYFFFLFR